MDLDTNIKCVAEINISEYLTKDEMHDIAVNAFRARIERVIDNILEARDISLSDLVLNQAVTKYTESFSEKFKSKLQEKINDVISGDLDSDEVYDLESRILSGLGMVLDSYIKENKTELQRKMTVNIDDACKKVADERLAKLIASRIDMTSIINDILSKKEEEG